MPHSIIPNLKMRLTICMVAILIFCHNSPANVAATEDMKAGDGLGFKWPGLNMATVEVSKEGKFMDDVVWVCPVVYDNVQRGTDFLRLSVGELILRTVDPCRHTRIVPHEGRELCKIWECSYDLDNIQYVHWLELDTTDVTTKLHLIGGQLSTHDLLNVTIQDCDSTNRCGGTTVLEFEGLDMTLVHTLTGNRAMEKVMIDESRPVVQELLGQLVKHAFQNAVQRRPCPYDSFRRS